MIQRDIPRLFNVAVDARVLMFALFLSIATAIIFGLLPAWRVSRSDPAHALRDSGLTMTVGLHRNRLHSALVVGETALVLRS